MDVAPEPRRSVKREAAPSGAPSEPISALYRRGAVTFELFDSANARMRDALECARRAAVTDIHIFIHGETGTGKNFLAQAIHNGSRRAGHLFLTVNCSALSESLLESELFGHERGAFTGADRLHRGYFEVAAGGTLFLDEIAELPLSMQAKLLHVVEYKQFLRVGGETVLAAEVRIVCASSQDLGGLVTKGRFRADLYHRLGEEVVVRIPPLRERPEDLPGLVRLFLDEWKHRLERPTLTLTADAECALLRADWPGNVRQLRNTLKRAIALAPGDRIEVRDLGMALRPEPTGDSDGDDLALVAAEARHIARVLELARGNKSRAAALLGIARTTLDRKLAALGAVRGADPASDRG